MLVVKYCDHCQNELLSYGELPSCLVIHILKMQVQDDCLVIIDTNRVTKNLGEPEIVRFLELKGFVVTTEYDREKLIVRPTGKLKQVCQEKYLFCSKDWKHE
jgi:hypothetical protein